MPLIAMTQMVVALKERPERYDLIEIGNGWKVRVMEELTRAQFGEACATNTSLPLKPDEGVTTNIEGPDQVPEDGLYFFRVGLTGVPYVCERCKVVAQRTLPEDADALGDMVAVYKRMPLDGNMFLRLCPPCIAPLRRHARS